MRKILVAMIILIVIVTGASLYVLQRTVAQAAEISSCIDSIENSVRDEDWSGAEGQLKELQNQWTQAQSFWSPLMDHTEIDDLDLALIRMAEYVQQRQQTEALTEIAVARRLLDNIKQKEIPRLENIF